MIGADSTTDSPLAGFGRIPGESDSRAEQILHWVGKYRWNRSDRRIGHLRIEIAARRKNQRAEVETIIPPSRVIPQVVPAQRQCQREVRLDFPIVLDEKAEGICLPAENDASGKSGQRIIGSYRFLKYVVRGQIEQVVEGETRAYVHRSEIAVLDCVIAVVTKFQRVLTSHQAKDAAPVIV